MVDSTPLIPHGDDNSSSSSSSSSSQGGGYLCCDSRKAIIVINSVFLGFWSLDLILLLANAVPLTIQQIIVISINMLFNIIVIYSALQFQYIAVIVAILWDVTIFILMIVSLIIGWRYGMNGIFGDAFKSFDILAIIFSVHKIYAECVFVYEVRKGIMSSETHSREKHSW